MTKKLALTLAVAMTAFLQFAWAAFPDEGMWLPMYIKQLNEKDMKALGLKLDADDIYNINHSSLKDAVVALNGGMCTAEIVSDQGLLLTNHHCGYDYIVDHSTVSQNYLKNGFWATKKEDELPNEGLTAAMLVYMQNVTKEVKGKLDKFKDQEMRDAAYKVVTDSIVTAAQKGNHYTASVKSFFNDNEYYLLVYEIFQDVRLVGAPPAYIGKFGGETDNWMWPRHTGDFSVFRIYTGPDGNPAPYSKGNIPYKPKKHFNISLQGEMKGDFAMILGYPGSTSRYITSYDLTLSKEYSNPPLIDAFRVQLDVMKQAMDKDSVIKLALATDYASFSNTYKYFVGQQRQLKQLNVIEQQLQEDDKFSEWVNADPERRQKYGDVIPSIKSANEKLESLEPTLSYFHNGLFQSKAFGYSFNYYPFYKMLNGPRTDENGNPVKGGPSKEELQNLVMQITPSVNANFERKELAVDKRILQELLAEMFKKIPADKRPPYLAEIYKKYHKDKEDTDQAFAAYVDGMYAKSMLLTKSKADAFLKNPNMKKLVKDPFYQMMKELISYYSEHLASIYYPTRDELDKSKQLYMEALREWKKDKVFYPDANSTLRLTYGTVQPYQPRDGVQYKYYTTYEGILQKQDPGDPEFYISEKLSKLLKEKKFGRYAQNDTLRVCFLTNNDITGGNSGSPVLDANGNLIGLAFDGNWEAMIGDIYVNPALNRTICVDIRYVLWTMDIFSGAKNLVDEMTLVP